MSTAAAAPPAAAVSAATAAARPSPLRDPIGWAWDVLREAGRFVRWQWLHVVAAPFVAVTLVTFLHELAHCVAVWVQGGTVTSFRFLPTADSYGMMTYEPPARGFFLPELVSLAPYLMWSGVAAFTVFLAIVPIRWPRAIASTLFVWMYVVPFLDIGMHLTTWALLGAAGNDITHALGRATLLDALFVAVVLPIGWAFTWLVQWRLYRDHSLSVAGYVVVTALGLLALATVIGTVTLLTML